MQGSLGEKIGEGAFSEAYAWAPGQVVKLFKAGVSHLLGRHEVRMIRAVRAAGVPAPEVFGKVTRICPSSAPSSCSATWCRHCGSG